ncbi:MAG: hypothetical protein K6U75_09280 [Firmicutes bacterium]|nr:hypothetical protein [Bacillota bacterium]
MPVHEVAFPVRLIDIHDGYFIEHGFDSLGSYVEWYDSDDPSDREEMVVLDKYGRPVSLLVRQMEVLRCRLYNPSEQQYHEILSLVEKAALNRQEWERKRREAAEARGVAGFWKRFLLWLKRF